MSVSLSSPEPPCPRQCPYQHYDVGACLGEQVQAVFVILPGAHGRPTQQLLVGILRGQRVIPVLLQVSAGNDGHQFITIVDNGQLP